MRIILNRYLRYFCFYQITYIFYQGKKNPGEDSDPKHWDVGLYLSGLDFWAVEGGQTSSITMGLATVTGICTKEYGCVIGEIGVHNQVHGGLFFQGPKN